MGPTPLVSGEAGEVHPLAPVRMAAVFTISTATIAARRGVPRWLVVFGAATGLVLLLTAGLVPWLEIIFPVWVFVVERAPTAGDLQDPGTFRAVTTTPVEPFVTPRMCMGFRGTWTVFSPESLAVGHIAVTPSPLVTRSGRGGIIAQAPP